MQRDTDADWVEIGRAQPYFGVLANDQYLADRIDGAAIEEFYESGHRDIEASTNALRQMSGRDVKVRTALDFGCGVGRLTLAMAPHADVVHGVDVSTSMLEIATRRAESAGVGNVDFTTTIPDTPLDWVNSLIVLQHIPPARGEAIIQQLVEQLTPGGFISLQVTFFKDRSHTGEIERDIDTYRYDGRTVEILTYRDDTPAGAMTMYDYDLNRIMAMLFRAGIAPVLVGHTDHGGCHGAYFYGVRAG